MLPTTIEVFKASLKADPTVTPADRTRLLATLRADGEQPTKPAPPPDDGPRIMRRAEVARRLSVSLRTVDKLPLRKFKLPGRARAAGFLASDVNGLLTERNAA